MALGRQVHARAAGRYVAKMSTHAAASQMSTGSKSMARIVATAASDSRFAGIGQLVDVDHARLRPGDQVADQCGADEAGAAGDEMSSVHQSIGVHSDGWNWASFAHNRNPRSRVVLGLKAEPLKSRFCS